MVNRVTRVDDRVTVQNVLVSVADKTGLDELIPRLVDMNGGIRFYSTGGTHRSLAEILGERSKENLRSVADYTGQPEMQGGLVKTLDFKIYLGLLSETYNSDHVKDLDRLGGVTFDLVVVNLYPFERAVAEGTTSCEGARAYIDIGGPCMLRAAAKNFLRVAVICDPGDYRAFATRLAAGNGTTSLKERFQLAQKAFRRTAAYDRGIADYLSGLNPEEVLGSYSLEEPNGGSGER